MTEKTEQPTPRRLRKAEDEGDSGASAALAQAIAFVAVATLAPAAVGALAERTQQALLGAIDLAGAPRAHLHFEPAALATDILALALPLLGASAVVSAASTLVQTRAAFAPARLAPRLERLDVLEGLRGLFRAPRLFAVARALAAAAVVVRIATLALERHAGDLARTVDETPPLLLSTLRRAASIAGDLAATVALRAALAGLALGAVDLVVTRASWRKRLFMSKEDVKREHRETEGDGHVKASLRRAHLEMLTAVAIASVRDASVVIVNPTHVACALRYAADDGDAAPIVLASGEGDLAQQIIRAARDYGVPVLHDIPLAHALRALEVGEAIPEELYEAVAEILREAWEAD